MAEDFFPQPEEQPQQPMTTAAVQPVNQSPAMPFQMAAANTPAANPYAVQVPSVLSTDDRQQKLGQAYDKFLSNIVSGPSRSDKAEDFGRKLFGNVIAPAVAAFGGAGTSAGAVQFMNKISADAKEARMQKEQESQHHMNALKSITDVVNTTSLKPLSALMKDYRKGLDQQQQAAALEEKKTYHSSLNEARATRQKSLDTARAAAQKLQQAGLQFKYDHLGMTSHFQEMADKRLRDIAILNAQGRARGQDMSQDASVRRLAAEYQMFNAKANEHAQFHNDEMLKYIMQRDAKDPTKYAHVDANGQPLNPADYLYAASPLSPQMDNNAKLSDQDYADAMKHVQHAPPPAAVPQMPQLDGQPQQQGQALLDVPAESMQSGQPSKPAAPVMQMDPKVLKSTFQQRIKAAGLSPDQGKVQFIQEAVKHGVPYKQASQMAEGL